MTPESQTYQYLTQPEIRFLDAAVERLIPADDLGPGAKDAGVTYFIDQQLVSVWGSHGRNYRAGPWPEGTPQQGFQSRLTPREIYRAAIREVNAHCLTQYRKAFEFLAPGEQDEVLKGLESGALRLASVSWVVPPAVICPHLSALRAARRRSLPSVETKTSLTACRPCATSTARPTSPP